MTTIISPLFGLDLYLLLVAIGILATLIYVVFFFKKEKPEQQNAPDDKLPKMPDIMGRTQSFERQMKPNEATQSQKQKPEKMPVTFAGEIPNEEPDDGFGDKEDPDPDEDEPDLQEEENEMQAYRSGAEDNEFASGITFEELNQTPVLLQKPELQPEEKKTVLHIAAKLADTELWDKIAQAIPQANEKIARLLDTSLPKVQPPNDWHSFDIRNFI